MSLSTILIIVLVFLLPLLFFRAVYWISDNRKYARIRAQEAEKREEP